MNRAARLKLEADREAAQYRANLAADAALAAPRRLPRPVPDLPPSEQMQRDDDQWDAETADRETERADDFNDDITDPE